MAEWFCKIEGKIYGPYPGSKLKEMAAEDRLMPEDLLREGEAGEWFPASEMENLFPKSAARERDDYDDRGDRQRKKKKRKGSNYYRLVLQNFQEGGQWTTVLLVTLGLQVLIPVIVGLLALALGGMTRAGVGRGIGAMVGVIILAAFMAVCILAVAFFIDVLVFGIPFSLMRVRLDTRRDSVLDLFAYSYLIGLVPKLIIIFVDLGSERWGGRAVVALSVLSRGRPGLSHVHVLGPGRGNLLDPGRHSFRVPDDAVDPVRPHQIALAWSLCSDRGGSHVDTNGV